MKKLKELMRALMVMALSLCLIAPMTAFAANADSDSSSRGASPNVSVKVDNEIASLEIDDSKKDDIPLITNALEVPIADDSFELFPIEVLSAEDLLIKDMPEAEYETKYDAIERPYPGKDITITKNIEDATKKSEMNRNIASNTDPNYAYLVSNDTYTYGEIETDYEFRWYAFVLNQKSKVTIKLDMVSALDADLYMFELNTQTYSLELFDGRTNAGGGVSERYTDVLSAGIYYIAVVGYSGTGIFAFDYYESSVDANYEINDTQSAATLAGLNANIVGVIDNPSDIDYYKFTVSTRTAIKTNFSSANGYTFGMISYSGSLPYWMPENPDVVILEPGTYYYVVYSSSGVYSSVSTYTVNFKKIADGLISLNIAPFLVINESGGIVFQSSANQESFYVNGNVIDYSYSYSYSGPSQNLNIAINVWNGVQCVLQNNWGVVGPFTVNYRASNRAYRYSPSKMLLALNLYSNPNILPPLYWIHCAASGPYVNTHLWEELNSVIVLIDPDTGLLIDIFQYNYFYDFIGGNNYLDTSTSYSTIYNYIR